MKYLILFLITFSAQANFIKKDQVSICGVKTVWLNQSKCGNDCIKIDSSYNCEYSELKDEMVEDLESPIWATRSMVEACSGKEQCEQMVSEKNCTDGRTAFTNAEFTETWCNKITGYNEKASGNKIVSINSTKKETYDSNKAAEMAMANAIAQAKKQMECGKNVIALLSVRNVPKDLTEAQMEELITTYAVTKSLLDSGALETARLKLTTIVPDGLIVTSQDVAALIAEIDKCL